MQKSYSNKEVKQKTGLSLSVSFIPKRSKKDSVKALFHSAGPCGVRQFFIAEKSSMPGSCRCGSGPG